MSEIWKPIKDYEKLYLVSNTGLIKSLNYLNKGVTKLLKIQDNGTGYKYVFLQKNKTVNKMYVHRIVMQSFIGFSELEVNHKDLNRSNNNLENLEYVTRKQNHKHREKLNPRARNCKGQFIKNVNI